MLTSGQKPTPTGQDPRFDAAERAAHHQQGRQHAARRARPERHRPDGRLDEEDADDRPRRHVALEELADGVVADAERLRKEQSADANCQAAYRRPPHPVERQPCEGVLRGVDARGEGAGQHAREQARERAAEQANRTDERRMRREREERAGPEQRWRAAAAVALARATGTKLRGFHSKSRSSTASNTAATGVANVADMPAAAPATSNVLRSALVRWKNCAITDPRRRRS